MGKHIIVDPQLHGNDVFYHHLLYYSKICERSNLSNYLAYVIHGNV